MASTGIANNPSPTSRKKPSMRVHPLSKKGLHSIVERLRQKLLHYFFIFLARITRRRPQSLTQQPLPAGAVT
jgi:hypothetical protein